MINWGKDLQMHMKFIVVAGGSGTKMWPLSREAKPKQFQPVLDGISLYQYQIQTLLQAFSAQDIFVSTKEQYVPIVVAQSPEIPLTNIIIEPNFAKNRGPGEGYAVLKLAELHPDEPFILVQSDCIRTPETEFLKMITEIEKVLIAERKFISGGNRPLYPDMGSDYLQLGDKSKSKTNLDLYNVEKFIPRLGDYNKTKELIESFHVSTHCNHTAYFPELLLNAYQEYRPDWYESLMKIRQTFGSPDERKLTSEIYAQMQEGPTEEVLKHLFPQGYIVLLPFKWIDIGTWDSMLQYRDAVSYAEPKEVLTIDSHGNLVLADKVTALLGVDNLVVVDTSDALLVCHKDRTGEIKKVLEELKNRKLEKTL